jgi:hypothetical protein
MRRGAKRDFDDQHPEEKWSEAEDNFCGKAQLFAG